MLEPAAFVIGPNIGLREVLLTVVVVVFVFAVPIWTYIRRRKIQQQRKSKEL